MWIAVSEPSLAARSTVRIMSARVQVVGVAV